jgi:tellurite methyltransferase
MTERRDVWNDRHSTGGTDDRPPEPLLAWATAAAPPGRALDLACGLGRNSIYLAERGWDVTAVDFSDVALAKVQKRSERVRIVRADLERGGFVIAADKYDLVVDCFFLHRPLFPDIRADIRAGGLFAGVLPVVDPQATTPMNPAFLVQPGELLTFFADWRIEHWSEERAGADASGRLRAQLVARRPG